MCSFSKFRYTKYTGLTIKLQDYCCLQTRQYFCNTDYREYWPTPQMNRISRFNLVRAFDSDKFRCSLFPSISISPSLSSPSLFGRNEMWISIIFW